MMSKTCKVCVDNEILTANVGDLLLDACRHDRTHYGLGTLQAAPSDAALIINTVVGA